MTRGGRAGSGRAGPAPAAPVTSPPAAPSGDLAIPLALAAVTLAVFSPAVRNGFVWDDYSNLVDNPAYRGLDWPHLRWMLTAVRTGHYIPLTWVSFGLDYAAWGLNPAGYHLTNLLLHAANVALLYVVARRLLRAATRLRGVAETVAAATAALFFGLHPLRAESVAWVTERRDVLSGLFFLLTVWAYLAAQAAEGARRRRRLAAAVVAYLGALLSKSLVMTVPAILLLLDVYPLRRLPADPRRWLTRSAGAVWLEKAPFALATAGAGVMAVYAQFAGSALGTYPWPTRIVAALYGCWFYPVRTLLPLRLSPLYEVPVPLDPWEPRFVSAALAVLALTVALAGLARRGWPAGLAAWAYQIIAIGPVSGLVVRAGFQLAADRYSYLAGLGWALLVGAGAGVVARRWAGRALRAGLAAGVGVAWLGALAVATWLQVQVWHDNERLWSHAVAATPDCALCHNNLGAALLSRGAPGPAAAHFQQALVIRPDRVEAREGLGLALAALGRVPEAVDQLRALLARRPDLVGARRELAAALLRMGRSGEAVAELQAAARTAPDDVAVRVSLGLALSEAGRSREAVPHFRRALAVNPDSGLARLGLVQAYRALGEADLAKEELEILRTRHPELARRAGLGPAPR